MGLRLLSSVLIILASIVVGSCGGGGGGGSGSGSEEAPPVAPGQVELVVSPVKGPMSNALVNIYRLDRSQPTLFNESDLMGSGMTDSSARLVTQFTLPGNTDLVIEVIGDNSIDLNTGTEPVIARLYTVISANSLIAKKPVYVTPLSTLGFFMLQSKASGGANIEDIDSELVALNAQLQNSLPYNFGPDINIFETLVVAPGISESDGDTFDKITTLRAINEAFAAMVVDAAADNSVFRSVFMRSLASEVVNGNFNTEDLTVTASGLDVTAFAANPFTLNVPNTDISVVNVSQLIVSESNILGIDTLYEQRPLTVDIAKLYTNSLAGGVDLEPVISFSASNINFGSVSVGGSAANSITLTNIGNASLTIANISASGNFAQTNSCNGFVPSGQSCTVTITFTPVSSGNMSGLLIVSGDGVATRTVSLLGVGDSGISRTNTVLSANFERLSRGAYKESDLRSDFNVGQEGYNDSVLGPNWNSTDIVADPANSGRGNVLRVLHRKGQGGNSIKAGGLRFRADMPEAEEYYLAYDYYVPSDWFQPFGHKMPGLINGTLLEASHAFGKKPTPETLVAFSARMQTLSRDAFPARGQGAMMGYYYDKDKVQRNDFLNTVDPTSESVSGQYRLPRGEWITIEQYMKVNTGGKKNGKLKVWIDGVLMSDQDHRWRDASSTRLIDGIFMVSYYGGNPSDVRNQSPADNYQYYDNFIVSDSPITH